MFEKIAYGIITISMSSSKLIHGSVNAYKESEILLSDSSIVSGELRNRLKGTVILWCLIWLIPWKRKVR